MNLLILVKMETKYTLKPLQESNYLLLKLQKLFPAIEA